MSSKMIPLSVPHIAGSEWNYVKDCLDTGWVSSVGNYVDRFERDLSNYVGQNFAVATTSGTAALHIALLVAGVKPNDEVLIPTLTFIAPANAIRYAQAWPIFIDAEVNYAQMDVKAVEDFLRNHCVSKHGMLHNKTTGRRIGALLPVHVLGHPVDMDFLISLAQEFCLPIVEDATESLGSKYKRKMTGTLGHISCFSFNGNKIITTGGGGMILTNNQEWAQRAKYLTTQAKDDPLEYIHHAIGYNYRLTNVQAAIGCAQIEQLSGFIEARRKIALRYEKKLLNVCGLRFLTDAAWAESNRWLSTVFVEETTFGESSRQVLRRLNQVGIQTRPLWQPIHLSPAHDSTDHRPCPMAEQIYSQALSLPSSPQLTPEEQDKVIFLLLENK